MDRSGSGVPVVLRKKIQTIRGRAKVSGLPFLLTDSEAAELLMSSCHYCGFFNWYGPNKAPNGLDRIDSSVGYEIGNVVACCKVCNWAKNDLSYREFILYLEKLVAFRVKNGPLVAK
jgi:hypothetical protein